MSTETINDIFYSVVERNSDRVMLHKPESEWTPISSRDLYRDVVGTAQALAKWGIKKGDRVAILSENRPEWAITEFATVLLGAVVVPIYATLTSDQISYILRDSGARVLFVSSNEQLKKFRAIQDKTQVERSVVMDYVGVTESVHMQRMMQEGPTERDAQFDAQARSIVTADDLETIIYTSGTTGTPKGAMLTHGNLVSNISRSMDDFPFAEGNDLYLSFLPLSHITARHVDCVMLWRGVTVAYCPDLTKVPEALSQVRPTILVAVPRVYEKMRAGVEQKASKGLKHALYKWAVGVGRAHMQQVLNGSKPSGLGWSLADKLIYSKVRAALGGRVQIFISGSAPLGRDLAQWYASIGIRIDEGYGLTETSPVIAVNNPVAHKLGTVGKPLKNVQVKIAEDGEILVKGPSIFKGYWNLPEETKVAFDPDGWFRTGDIGELDSEGFLSITDRKKDLIKTSGGKFIAPQPIENALKANPLIAEVAMLGDRRKFPAVVIAPNFALLEEWAREHNVPVGSREALIQDVKIRSLYDGIVAKLNEDLAKFEKIKKVLLIADEFTIANGLLTPTMKLRRRVLEERYCKQIDELYAEPLPSVQAAMK